MLTYETELNGNVVKKTITKYQVQLFGYMYKKITELL